MKKPSPAIISLIVIALIAVGAGAYYIADQAMQEESSQTETVDDVAPASDAPSDTAIDDSTSDTDGTATGDDTPVSNDATTSSSVYTNGTYTAKGNYSTPGGTESITVTVTLNNDVITSVSATGSATGGNSAQYQRQFLSGYTSLVEGKSIDEVQLSRVAGSSLTSSGFNRAIDSIQDEAKA